jgi:nicotinamide-nucleotide adenylyltransferase
MNISLASPVLRNYQRIQRVLTRLDAATGPCALASPGSAVPRGNLIVFPGSFNPPTPAHLALLRQARCFARHSDAGDWQIYAALSRQIVDKEAVERMTLLDRVYLLERVLKRRGSHAGILLLNRGLYVEQAQAIRASFPSVLRLYFLLGFDKIVQILDPRYYRDREAALCQLFAQAHLLVAPRGTDGAAELQSLLKQPENRAFARFIHPLPLEARYRNISSTHVRQQPTSDEVPEEVRDFLLRTHPYAPPSILEDGTMSDPYAERTRMLQQLLTQS